MDNHALILRLLLFAMETSKRSMKACMLGASGKGPLPANILDQSYFSFDSVRSCSSNPSGCAMRKW